MAGAGAEIKKHVNSFFMTRRIFRASLTGIALICFFAAKAQDYAESAFTFSRKLPSGSARILGLGGSQVALGGDYSAGLSNPAGLGMYNKAEFTFSLGYTDHSTTADYYGVKTDDNRSIFNIPGFSYVWHFPNRDEKFISGALAISFSRTSDFNRSTTYQGSNQNKSMIDYFIEQANGFTTQQFEPDEHHYNTPTGLSYYNFLIGPVSTFDPTGPDDVYFTFAPFPEVQQEMEEIAVKGATNQWSISYGGNIQDKFFFGGGIGVSNLRYVSKKNYTETFDSDTLLSFHLLENLTIRGTGINATVGAILRPADFLQLGISYTTPTFFGLTETYDASMDSRWNGFDYYGDGSEILGDNNGDPITTDIVTSDYTLTLPMKVSGGVAFITKYGFLTGDIEFTNPARAKYKSDVSGISFNDENNTIKNTYQPVINYRLGAEFRHDIFRVRAGYGMQSNAYSERINADNKITSISGGIGVRTRTFFVDLAIIQAKENYRYQSYSFEDSSGPGANITHKTINGVVTVGFSL
jgi:hypothetical protein